MLKQYILDSIDSLRRALWNKSEENRSKYLEAVAREARALCDPAVIAYLKEHLQ